MGKVDYNLFLKRKAEVKDDEINKTDFGKFEEDTKKFLKSTGLSNSSLAEQLKQKILKIQE